MSNPLCFMFLTVRLYCRRDNRGTPLPSHHDLRITMGFTFFFFLLLLRVLDAISGSLFAKPTLASRKKSNLDLLQSYTLDTMGSGTVYSVLSCILRASNRQGEISPQRKKEGCRARRLPPATRRPQLPKTQRGKRAPARTARRDDFMNTCCALNARLVVLN